MSDEKNRPLTTLDLLAYFCNDIAIPLDQTVRCPFCGFKSTEIFYDRLCGRAPTEGDLVGCGNCAEDNIFLVTPDGLKQIRGPETDQQK